MSWVYEQGSGNLIHNGELIGTGYAGKGDARNVPDRQDEPYAGPIPCGTYTIGAPIADGGGMGPFVLPLTPWPGNNMVQRGGFFIHGGGPVLPPDGASDGSIVTSRINRSLIAQSGDTVLIVT